MAAYRMVFALAALSLAALCRATPAGQHRQRRGIDDSHNHSCQIGEHPNSNGLCVTICGLGDEYYWTPQDKCRRKTPHPPCGPGSYEVGGTYGDCAVDCPLEPLYKWAVGFGCVRDWSVQEE